MNRKRSRNTPTTTLRAATSAATFALLLLAGAAQAGDWSWTITPYAWATDVGVNAELDGRQVVDETIPVTDLIEDIDLIFQGRIEARSGAHGVMLDLFYVAMSDEVGGLALPQNAGQADLDWTMDMTIADVAGIYDPNRGGPGVSFLYGARVIHEGATVDARFTTPGGSVPQSYEASETLVDALAGIRFTKPLTRRLSWQMQADVSTGGTDLTWSAFPSLSYAFGDGRRAVTVGYRRMTVDFENHDGLDSEMTLSGLVLGYRMSF